MVAKDFLVHMKGDLGAAPVGGGRADLGQLALWNAARKALFVEFLVLGNLDHKTVGQRIDNGRADPPMQAARSLIGLARELSARMQFGKDHLQRGFFREFRVWINRNATPVVRHSQRIVRVQRDLDPVGKPCDGLVHRVVDDLGRHVVQGAFIGAADIHAGTFAHGLHAVQVFNRGGVISVGPPGGRQEVVHAGCSSLVVG